MLCLLFLCLLSSLSAHNVEWTWNNTDDSVNYYRYQLNGEEDGKWTVVDGRATGVVLEEETVNDILYVQASYDGEKWSPSAKGIRGCTCSCTSLTWSWESGDDAIMYYRWSFNGGDWREVDGDVSSVTLNAKEGTNTFSLEASYDGVNWSEAKSSTYIQSPCACSEKEKYEVSLLLSPYTLQKVTYSGKRTPSSRTTSWGNMFGLGFTYSMTSEFGVSAGISSSWHRYNEFHEYRDIKTDVRMCFKVLESDNLQYRMYLLLGAGIDSVWRDDGDWGCYPMVIGGIKESFFLKENTSLDWGCDAAYTFQDGSRVFHLLPYISLSYHWKGACK